jgi:hypothetical protein
MAAADRQSVTGTRPFKFTYRKTGPWLSVVLEHIALA